MVNQVNEIVDYLKNIQDNMVGIIVPALITAIVSLLTLGINSFIIVIQEKNKYKSIQFKEMQNIYPSLKIHLQNLRFFALDVRESQRLYKTSMSNALLEFFSFKKDEKSFRESHLKEIQEISKFVNSMENYVNEMMQLDMFFCNHSMPSPPWFHPILKHSLYKMIASLQFYTCLLSKIDQTPTELNLISKELSNFRIDAEQLEKYILIIDKWYHAY